MRQTPPLATMRVLHHHLRRGESLCYGVYRTARCLGCVVRGGATCVVGGSRHGHVAGRVCRGTRPASPAWPALRPAVSADLPGGGAPVRLHYPGRGGPVVPGTSCPLGPPVSARPLPHADWRAVPLAAAPPERGRVRGTRRTGSWPAHLCGPP